METLQDLVHESGSRHAHRPALQIRPSFRTRTWRYRDLRRDVPRAAQVLADAGVRPGDRFLIWAANRPEWGIAFLAGAWAGAVAVPIDVRHDPGFAARIVAQTGAVLVLASRQTEAAVRTLGIPILFIEALPDLVRRTAPLEPAPLEPDDLAEIVFTSGTTGNPKGAMVTHRNLLANATSVTAVFGMTHRERLLSILPLSHLYEQTIGLVGPLLVGASVVYPISRQPAVIMRTLRDFRITLLLIVPQGLRVIENAIGRRVDQSGRRATFERLHGIGRRLPMRLRRLLFLPVHAALGGRLRTIGVGASALDPELGQRWLDRGVDVLQGYGATEMSPVIAFNRPARNRLGTVGEAIPGVRVRIAEDGEILAAGPNRFAGYWQNPEATAAAIDADGWYHTGDLGELSGDGFLTIRGRKKDMLALPDGQKVYPEDVESAIALDPRVRDSAVVGWPQAADLRVHAVLLTDEPSAADAIVAAANRRLAPHQQIRGHSTWPEEDFPRTHTLKIRKHEVLAWLTADSRAGAPGSGSAAVGAAGAHVATSSTGPAPGLPEDPVVTILAAIAGIPAARIRPEARLSSDLDLDSLRRVELLGVIEEELGTFVDDDALEPDATVATLLAMVEAARHEQGKRGIHGWPLSPVVRAVGILAQTALITPVVGLFYRVRDTDLQRLRALDGPVVFTPNHCLHLDNAILLANLPIGLRWRLSFAAAADTIYSPRVKGVLASILANAFPLAREGGVRHSLEMLGARLDRGFSVVIYPEGKLTVGGPTQPFKPGIGLIAVDGALPIVPVKLRINRMSILDRRTLRGPIRGDVEVRVGNPIVFDAGTDAATATTRLEAALAAL